MRILVAGASGAIGRQLLPLLDQVGHEAIALVHRTPPAHAAAHIITADALERPTLTAAVAELAPEVVVNLLTAIPRQLDPRRFELQFAQTNRLRTEGTANLIAAAPNARMISEGLAFAYSPEGGPVADEERPFWTEGPKPFRPAVRALLELERLTTQAGGLVLRFGHLYGTGTSFAADGPVTERVKAGRMPIVGDGSGRFSFIHTGDAATAIVAAIDKPRLAGALNVVDDEPLETRRWLPQFAQIVGGPRPKRAPEWIARLVAGSWGVAYMNELVGADNIRARGALDWRPRFASPLGGWRAEVEVPASS